MICIWISIDSGRCLGKPNGDPYRSATDAGSARLPGARLFLDPQDEGAGGAHFVRLDRVDRPLHVGFVRLVRDDRDRRCDRQDELGRLYLLIVRRFTVTLHDTRSNGSLPSCSNAASRKAVQRWYPAANLAGAHRELADRTGRR